VGNLKDAMICGELAAYPGKTAVEVIFHSSVEIGYLSATTLIFTA
jgi:hypothetical protein